MTVHSSPVDVGAPIESKRTSPILDSSMAEEEVIEPEIPEERQCYFNDVVFKQGDYVQSGGTLLRCDRGVWVDVGEDHEFEVP